MKKNNVMRFSIVCCLLGVLLWQCNSRSDNELYGDEVLFDPAQWVVEQQPGGEVLFTEQGIEILDSSGCTVWFKHKLEGPLMIEYQVTMIDEQGPYDRVSDMNVFWMATDPIDSYNLFHAESQRFGQFRQYDRLNLYYVGCGGHNNTRTRFRRYNGTDNRPLEEAHDLSSSEVLLTPNHKYTVQLIANKGHVQYIRDGKVIFDVKDSEPYTSGWFGLRTYKSHQLLSGLKIKTLH
ncbi:hypothetical protein KEM09_16845 [Carboxylicivirga mesophila]|uniref:DUF6250 domain-containing protein n=1 Tax=Carboxylicivirga mesophila TaxID=1166478 RepID=A0ABS5KDI7_9BACT|nr:DUF6250 domain-containing protein [Carboxylicivirga mesophila]MBS2213088.1 hypothetical protein [Carboxylicivirga mesophila]